MNHLIRVIILLSLTFTLIHREVLLAASYDQFDDRLSPPTTFMEYLSTRSVGDETNAVREVPSSTFYPERSTTSTCPEDLHKELGACFRAFNDSRSDYCVGRSIDNIQGTGKAIFCR